MEGVFRVVHQDMGYIDEIELSDLPSALSHLFDQLSEYGIELTGFYEVGHFDENNNWVVDFKSSSRKLRKLKKKGML